MANFYYSRVVPDMNSSEVYTPDSPGYVVEVFEDDAGVGVQLRRTDKMDSSDPKDFTKIFINPDETEDLIAALREATNAARRGLNGPGWVGRVYIPESGL